METESLFKQAKKAEVRLAAELNELSINVDAEINVRKKITRKKIKETIEESPEQINARLHVEHLQLRCELLRNIRMNWRGFEKHAIERGIELRINQFSALQHLIHFLDTGEGQEGEIEDTQEKSEEKAMMAYEVQPTGAGKTGAFAIETALLGVPTLILVPFDNLLQQSKDDLIKIGGFDPEDIGIVGGGDKEFGRLVTVATYQGHSIQMKRKSEYANHIKNNVKFCICDEVHTSLGERTQESLESIDDMSNEEMNFLEENALKAEEEVIKHLEEQTSLKSLKIGFTATPKLAQKHVQQYFPNFLGRVYHRDMVEAGILVPYRIVQCNGSVSEGEIGQAITEELEVKILNREDIYNKLLGEYVDALSTYEKMKKKNTYPLRGMAFCTNRNECLKFASQAAELGLRCEIITGKEAPGKQGREVINEAKEKMCRGEIDLIVTVEKLCAGFNFPEINAVIWARITSMAKTIQGIGRGARSHKEGKMKKDCCWVFETNWSLKNNAKRGKKPLRIADALSQNGEDPEKTCTMADGSVLTYDKIFTKEEIAALIKEEFTPVEWSELTHNQRLKLKIGNYGLTAVASMFGIFENVIDRTDASMKLGRAIWGEHPAFAFVDFENMEKCELVPIVISGLAEHGILNRVDLLRFNPGLFYKLKFSKIGGSLTLYRLVTGKITQSYLSKEHLKEIADICFPEENSIIELIKNTLNAHGINNQNDLLAINPGIFERMQFEGIGKGRSIYQFALNKKIGIGTFRKSHLQEIADSIFPIDNKKLLEMFKEAAIDAGFTDKKSFVSIRPYKFQLTEFKPYGKGRKFYSRVKGENLPTNVLISEEHIEELADILFN